MNCDSAWGQWKVEHLQYTATMPGGRGQWTSHNALPHRLGAVGHGTGCTVFSLAHMCRRTTGGGRARSLYATSHALPRGF